MPRTSKTNSWTAFWVLLGILALTALVYFPGLHGDFEFDDGPNILNNTYLQISRLSWDSLREAAFSGFAGPLGRPISMASFALNYYSTGAAPFYFKLTNLIVHLLAGLGVFFLTRLLFVALRNHRHSAPVPSQEVWLALLVTAAWLLHPLNLTSVLYIVQRMTSLSGLFMFWGLALYAWGRLNLVRGRNGRGMGLILVGLFLFGGLSVLSKENGALMPLFMLVTEITVFRLAVQDPRVRTFLLGFLGLFAVVPLLVGVVFLATHTHWLLAGYDGREFTLMERVLTQPRALFYYLRLTFVPSASAMGIFHDDFVISRSLLEPATTPFAIAGILLLLGTAVASIKRAPVLAFGLLWFFVGQSIESSIIPLDMVYEHRNYVPLYGILFAVFYYLFHPRFSLLLNRTKYAIAIGFVTLLAVVTWIRSEQWSGLFVHAVVEVHNHPLSTRANYQMGRMYFTLFANEGKERDYEQSRYYLERAAWISGSDISPLIGELQLGYKARKPVDLSLVGEIERRLQQLPPRSPNITALQDFENCQINLYCKLPDKDMIGILSAMLRNPKAPARMKGDANTLIGTYYSNKLHDLAAAGKYVKAAVAAEPGLALRRIGLARWYSIQGQFAAAREQLEMARKVDRLGEYQSDIAAEERFLVSTEKRERATR